MKRPSSQASALPRRQPPAAPTLAAIDMGSNSFRVEIARVNGQRYERIEYLKETVRLGGGLDAQGMLGSEAIDRGLACLARFGARLRDMPTPHVRAVATQTLREARNRDAFLAEAVKVLGHPIEVISGREEARLIFAGVARLQPSTVPRLVIDIGGRSTEMIIGRGLEPEVAESFQVGSVGLSMNFFADGRFSSEAFRAAQVAVAAELEEAHATFKPTRWREVLGSSGTVGAVAQILAAEGITDGRITLPALRWCIEACLRAGSQDALKLAGLKPERRAVVGGGLAVLYTLLHLFGIAELRPARGALRQGVIFDLAARLDAGRAHAADAREASVSALQQRFAVDTEHAQQVATLAERLFASLPARGPTTTDEASRELRWAALLHEVGMMVSHHDHHRHSAYLIANVDAAGFSQSQQRLLGQLVLAQRGGLRKVEAALADNPTLAWQALCLRLAVIACHARAPLPRDTLAIDVGKASGAQAPAVRVAVSPRWAQDHPQTLYLLQQECEHWARSGRLTLHTQRLDPVH